MSIFLVNTYFIFYREHTIFVKHLKHYQAVLLWCCCAVPEWNDAHFKALLYHIWFSMAANKPSLNAMTQLKNTSIFQDAGCSSAPTVLCVIVPCDKGTQTKSELKMLNWYQFEPLINSHTPVWIKICIIERKSQKVAGDSWALWCMIQS